MDADASRGRVLLEESREAVVVLDDDDVVVVASRRARQSIDGLLEGERIPDGLLSGTAVSCRWSSPTTSTGGASGSST